MTNIRAAIQNYLKSLISYPVYYQRAPSKAEFPYVVCFIPTILSDGECTQTVSLEIDGWDNQQDSFVLEKMMVDINKIDKHVVETDALSIVFYLENRLCIDDNEPGIKRRKYVYAGKLFEI